MQAQKKEKKVRKVEIEFEKGQQGTCNDKLNELTD